MEPDQDLRRERRRQMLYYRWRRRQLSAGILLLSTMCAMVSVFYTLACPISNTTTSEVEASLVEEEDVEEGVNIPQIEVAVQTPGNLVLVNSEHGWDDGSTGTLVSVYECKNDCYGVRDTEILLDEMVIEPLNQMISDFVAATGNQNVVVCAGHRTVAYQQMLWDNSLENNGEEYTASYIAVPGYSEHHTGLVLDLAYYSASRQLSYDFDGTGDSAWFLEHCWEYGFVQRYPSGKEDITGISTEEWHFRYVGLPHSYIMEEKNLCLEEYLLYLQQYPADGDHLYVSYSDISYEIWYSSTATVFEAGDYMVSADNCGGYIITRTLS